MTVAVPPPDPDGETIKIHALTVGEGILALSALPGRGGNLQGDLHHIADWRPALVITLVTEDELAEVGASAIGRWLKDHGTKWEHLPIPDFSTPDAAASVRWDRIAEFARRALLGGGRVLVHCRGGCGRSGMVALRLMIEAGEAPDEALGRLRCVRPCAIETDAQMAWAMGDASDAAEAQHDRG
ncbi:hypothetical protein GCM10011415_22820 [Salipiger pallidus]|uniref:Tyrosine specific protein phosphatases domain-containing protein n=1 Tax=Salipiger pallidus TaxID=1775170 RepID=A0A8J3EG45_9RHOB|nr:dual specificity protein phosphatase family protein [Salipiger pallidus]GGG73861.1 hypothetical protein GCM10011415_22820 [Salipiger pallidus]